MNTLAWYLILSTGCLSILYGIYQLLVKHNTTLRYMRWYLLLSIFISLIAPLNRYSPFSVDLPAPISGGDNTPTITTTETKNNTSSTVALPVTRTINWPATIALIYAIITGLLLLRFLWQFYTLYSCYWQGTKEKRDGYTIVWNSRYKSPFSFFQLIFLNSQHLPTAQQPTIIAHEKVHIQQLHSIDNILVEIMVAFTWFNPGIWLFRRSVRLVHEYLADEGVLHTGTDPLHYQALLLNQVAETELVAIYSGFNQSSINKRFVMMRKTPPQATSRFKLLLLIPVTGFLLPFTGCLNERTGNEHKDKEVITSVAATKLNVLYIGVENPVNISVSDYGADAVSVSIDNGSITGSDGKYIVKPHQAGTAIIKVAAKGKTVQETEFRVKYLPPPVVALKPVGSNSSYIKGGNISKASLLQAGGIRIGIENSEFEVPIKVASFDLVTKAGDNNDNKTISAAESNFSAEQIDLIKSLKKGQQLSIENIVGSGPGGNRKTPFVMQFTITE